MPLFTLNKGELFSYRIIAKITIMIKKTIKTKKRIFRIPQPVFPAPLKPKIPEKIINTTAIIARIQKILILYSFSPITFLLFPGFTMQLLTCNLEYKEFYRKNFLYL